MIAPRSPGLFLFLILAVPVVAQDPPPPTFDLLPAFGVGMKTEDIAIADYDGDGELDAAMGNTYFNLSPELGSFSVIFNEGDGTFTQMVGIEQFVGFRTEGLTAGDFNGDGYADLAAANFNIASSNVVILLSDGPSRTFTEIQTIPLSTGGVLHPPRHIRAGHWNLDEDNFLDLATANHDNDTVSLLTGNGDGTFSLLEPFIAVGDGPETVSVANLNGDSDIDILITNAESNTMTVLLGTAGANFSVAASFPSGGSRPRFASAFDFDGDGLDDFVVSHWENPGETLVYRNLGAGTAFSVEASLAIPGNNTSPIHPTIGDLNNDGIPDIIVSYYREDSIVLYPGLPTGSFDFGAAQTFAAGDGPYGTVIMNFDASSGDTRNDLILTNTRDHEVWIFLGMQVGDNPPDAVVDVFTIEEDSAASILDVLANDSDPDAGDTLTITNVTSPSMGGAVSIVSAGTELSYTPPAATTGDETFDYTIEDSQGNTDTATVTVTIFATAPNQPPLAVNDAFGVTVGTNDNTLLVLTNDSDPDVGDTLTITSVGPTSAGGTATIASGSTSVLYSPGSGFSGDETFDYTIEDPDGASATATVTVTVGEQLAFLQDNGSQGFLVVEAENYHEHTPRSGYDWLFGTTPADFGGTGTMTVLPEDFQSFSSNYAANAPELKFYFQAAHSGTHYVWARGHGPNSGSNSLHVGLDGAEVPSAAAVPIPTGGGYSWSNDVRTLEVPAPGLYCLNVWGRETGTVVDRLVLTIDPAFTPSGMGPAESPQQGQNLPPIAVADNATVDEDSTANVIQVLTNDSDPELDPFTIIAVSNPTNGTASIVNGDTEVAYTPFADFGGADSFTYTISDGNGTATATVSVTVTGLPDSPTAADDLTFSVAENSGANSLNVLANDSDPDVGDTLTIVNVTATLLGGTATITGGGATLAYTPPADTFGVDSFDYTIEDAAGNPATATVVVTITLGPPNVPPVAIDDAFAVLEGSVGSTLDVLGNDDDPDGTTLVITFVGGPDQGGTASSINGGTAISYTPAGGFTGEETFDYMIEDASAASALATVTVTVVPGGTGVFLMSSGPDGLLVIEAEDFHRETNSSDGDDAGWELVANPPADVQGDAVHILPDVSGPWPTDYALAAPELEFDFIATQTGTFFVWVLGQADNGGKNSVHVGIDGLEAVTAQKIEFDKDDPDWNWNTNLHTVEVDAPGPHTLNLWGRERATKVDRLLLTRDPDFVPAGSGPSASPTDQNPPTATTRVIQISVSGLHADAVATLGASLAPNLFRLRTEGAFTDAARADPDSTATVPNHASLLTGRFVLGASGHGWVTDAVSCGGGAPSNVHGGGYVDSAFDVAHDNGLSTAFYASRDELCLVEQSWDGANGAPDTTGSDDGTDKIDHVFRANSDDDTVVTQFVAALQSSHHDLSVVQLGGPEVVGHASGFDLSVGSSYLGAVESLDARLGDILDTIDADPNLVGNTFVILTAEHGGALLTSDHLDPGLLDNAAVPFYVWGPGVLAGADLYAANGGFRLDPGATVPPALTTPPPIRGADAPNLALDLLGLPAVPGSTINAAQDLLVP